MNSQDEPIPSSEREFPVILLVEDEALVAFVVALFLRDHDFKVIEARTGREAIEVLSTSTHVDLVVSDVMMPGGVSGFDVARWIDRNRPGLPVILASGVPRQSGNGSNDEFKWPFVAKPYDVGILLEMVRQALDQADSR